MAANPREGHCYALALMAIINGEPGMLVHGVVDNYGGHAWLEHGDTIHDVVSDTWIPASHYPGRCVCRYNREEALAMALQFRHCGPWPQAVAQLSSVSSSA